MRLSIVTPSFRSSAWLKLCIASVADQDMEHEHIVQDSCSDDGTQDWLPHDQRVRAFIEKDAGMYDAINRGYGRARGELVAHLNCDEQYLPGALRFVSEFFDKNPQVDVLLAATIITDAAGRYVCHRHSMAPHRHAIWHRFPILTSSLFMRRTVVDRGILFDTRWRALGDFHWISSLLENRVTMASSNVVTSVFADTGENLSLHPTAIQEKVRTMEMMPPWIRLTKPMWVGYHRVRRLLEGHFNSRPASYSIYTMQSPAQRVQFDVAKSTGIWWNRL